MLATRPLFFLSAALMGGVGVAILHPIPLAVAAAVGVAAIALVVVSPRYALVGILLAAAVAGVLRYEATTSIAATDIGHFAPATVARVAGYVCSDPGYRAGRLTFRLEASRVDAHGASNFVTGEAVVGIAMRTGEIPPQIGEGDRIEFTGSLYNLDGVANPGGNGWNEHLSRQGVRCGIWVQRAGSVQVLAGGRPNWFRHAAWEARAALLKGLRASLPGADASVLAGVLLGLRADLSPALLTAFVATGTIHILATAGLHVGIVYKLFMTLLEKLTVHRKVAALGTIAAIWMYDLMAGGRMAVTRAAIMATIYLFAIVVERTPDVLNSLGAAALAIIFTEPTQLLETGFETSFGAVLMIAVMMPVWEKLWDDPLNCIRGRFQRRAARRTAELCGLTLFAQTGASPVLASAFNVVSFTGSIANLIVVPVLFYLIPAGLAIAAFGDIAPALATTLARYLVSPAIGFITLVVNECAHLPMAQFVVTSPPSILVAIFYALIAAGYFVIERRLLLTRNLKSNREGDAGVISATIT